MLRRLCSFMVANLFAAALASSHAVAGQALHFEPPHKHPALARAILITGDGGYTRIEKAIARRLSRDGVDVVTLDSRTYFSSPHSVKWIAASLETLSRAPNSAPVVLVGYSFGADLIPLIWPDLDRAARARISSVALISPTHDASTTVDASGRYDPATMPMVDLATHAGNLPLERLTCISGRVEVASGYSSCRDAALAGARVIELDGGHDFGGNSDAVAQLVAELVTNTMSLGSVQALPRMGSVKHPSSDRRVR